MTKINVFIPTQTQTQTRSFRAASERRDQRISQQFVSVGQVIVTDPLGRTTIVLSNNFSTPTATLFQHVIPGQRD